MHFNTVSSWVVIDEKHTEEFNVEQSEIDGIPHLTCWIGSQLGKNFEVHYRDSSGKIFMATVFVDGYKCGRRIVRKSIGYMDGIYTSETTARPFIFSSPNFTEEEGPVALGSLSNIGEIEVKIGYAVIIREKQTFCPVQVPTEQKVNEKEKKGIDHQTRFGEDRVQRNLSAAQSQQIGKDVVRFCFRYRSLDLLRARGIAPPDLVPDIQTTTLASSSQSHPSRKRLLSTEREDVKPQIADNVAPKLPNPEDERVATKQPKKEPLGTPMPGYSSQSQPTRKCLVSTEPEDVKPPTADNVAPHPEDEQVATKRSKKEPLGTPMPGQVN